MLKRTDIVDKKMLDDLKVMTSFDCRHWDCRDCPFDVGDNGSGCASHNAFRMIDRYESGEEVIY